MPAPPSTARWAEVKRRLNEALDRPADERAAVFQGCAPDVRAEVEALLAADDADRLGAPLVSGGALALLAAEALGGADPLAGTRAGPYRLEHVLGRGGMGAVYRASRADGAFEREVAIKLLHPGLGAGAGATAAPDGPAGPSLRARFDAERRLLAQLDHPSIARLTDGGTVAEGPAAGTPFLVMDLVEGEPLTDYAARRRLPLDARVRLFLAAADAVAYAHQRLVVHRDLKPAHVLVADDEGAPRVTLLDFGVAALLGEDDRHAPLTPAYAAPEQRRAEPVTTATDVFALGVVLYELLTGVRPPETARPPSAAALPGAAVPASALRGDLDAICLRALAPEPAQRYASAEALAADLRRWAAHVPVEARAATPALRLGRFLRRNRLGVALGAVAALVLVGGGALTVTRVAAERDRARHEAEKAAQVAAFMGGLFRDADPAETGGTRVSAREVLDRAAARLARDAATQPAVRAQLYQALGEVYGSLALFPEAARLLGVADSLRTAALGADAPDRADGLLALARLRTDQGAYRDAEALARQALGLRLRAADPADRARAEAGLAGVLLSRGAAADAEALLRRALDRAPGDDAIRLALGRAAQAQDRFDDAEALLRSVARDRAARRGQAHPSTAEATNALADLLRDTGRYAEARPLYVRAVATARRLHGPDHPEVAEAQRRLALLAIDMERLDEAERLLLRSLPALRRTFEQPNVRVARHLHALAALALHRSDYADARARLDEALGIALRAVGERHPLTSDLLADRAYARGYTDDMEGAEVDYRRVLAIETALRGPAHSSVATVTSSLASLVYDLGRPDEGIALGREALALRRRILPPGHPDLGNSLYTVATQLFYSDRPAEAEPLLDECAALRRAAHGADDWRTIQADGRLAHVRSRLRRAGAAEGLADALARGRALAPERAWVTAQVAGALAEHHEARGQTAAAARLRQLEAAETARYEATITG